MQREVPAEAKTEGSIEWRSYVCHDSFTWDMTHSYVVHERVMSHISAADAARGVPADSTTIKISDIVGYFIHM